MKELSSVLTDNMDMCIYTGSYDVERHHVFGGSNKKLSEKYGYIAPLRKDLHPNGVYADHKKSKLVDTELKRICQEHYESHHGTREEFIKEFGRSYIL